MLHTIGQLKFLKLATEQVDDHALVEQRKDYTCGPSSIKTIANLAGKPVSAGKVEHNCRLTAKDGTSFSGMVDGLRGAGLPANPIKPKSEGQAVEQLDDALGKDKPVAWSHQSGGVDHWAVVTDKKPDGYRVLDPYDGPTTLSKKELVERWEPKKFKAVVSDRVEQHPKQGSTMSNPRTAGQLAFLKRAVEDGEPKHKHKNKLLTGGGVLLTAGLGAAAHGQPGHVHDAGCAGGTCSAPPAVAM